ncbi:MAG: hypothetical protein AAFP83_05880 [Bacteroidota bacterium]
MRTNLERPTLSVGQKGIFGIVYGVIYGLSMLPFGLWYGLSGGIAWVLRVLVKYRKDVILQNFSRSFPEKSPDEIQLLARQFYQHFADFLVETVKSISISEEELRRRVRLINPEVIDDIIAQPEGHLLVATHFGNFEWMESRLALASRGCVNSYGIYSPLRSWVFDELTLRMRTRFGVTLLPMRHAMIQAIRTLKTHSFFGFINDQSPHHGQRLYFTPFLHQATPYHASVAKIGLKTGANMYYADMRKVKRGYYTLEIVPIDTTAFLPYTQENIYRLTDHQASLLEATIQAQPAYWLWSHRRWKHKPRPGDILSTQFSASQIVSIEAESEEIKGKEGNV